MEFRAEARYMRVSPQKARLVLDLIKGRRVEDAMNTLMFTRKGIAPTVQKLLRSAVENANYLSTEKGVEVDLDNLYVKRAVANEGPRMKRIRPAPMGRAYRYQRRMAHLEIALEERNRGNHGQDVASTVTAESAAPARQAKSCGPQAGRPDQEQGQEAREVQEEVSSGQGTAFSCADQSLRMRLQPLGLESREYGTKSSSIRIPHRLHQALEVALVRGPRLRQAAAGRRQAQE